jgi:hypothetical protein
MVQGALFMPGFARAHCHGDGTPIRSGTSGTKTARAVPPDLSRYRLSRLICRRPTSVASGNRELAYPACRGLAQRYGSTEARWLGSRLRRSAGGCAGGYGAQNEHRKVRSVVDDRAESAGDAAVAAICPQIRKPVWSEVMTCHPGATRGTGVGSRNRRRNRSSCARRCSHGAGDCGASRPHMPRLLGA